MQTRTDPYMEVKKLLSDEVNGFDGSKKAVVGVKTGGSRVGGPELCVKAGW